MVNRANGTRANGHRANGIRADVVAPPEIGLVRSRIELTGCIKYTMLVAP